MSSNEQPCPIWDEPPYVWSIHEQDQIRGTHCTGGEFLLMRSGADLLQKLTQWQKANLSYWIHEYNLRLRMLDKSSWQSENLLELDQAWVERHRDLTPSASERMLMFLRELIRCDDADEEPNESL